MFSESVARLGITTPYDEALWSEANGDASLYALLKGIIASESSWNPGAINPSDPSYGLMQLTLPTARIFYPGATADELVRDPYLNLAIGAAFVRDLLRRFAPSDAVAHYNAGCPTPRTAGLSGCPLRNSSGQYVNSHGSTAVQAYVDSVLTYQVYYLNHLPSESLAGDEGGGVIVGGFDDLMEGWGTSPGDIEPTTVMSALALVGAAMLLS